MGVIEDGTATGHLPSTKVFAVHYPAYPSSMSRAIETLGGPDTIAKVRTSTSNKVELRFRPEDPFSHPAFGQLQPCNNLLLKISRKNNSGFQNHSVFNGQSNESGSMGNLAQTEKESAASTSMSNTQTTENSGVLTADIVARVQEAYHFTGMVDYQHVIAVHADVARRKRGKLAEAKEPFDKEDLGDEDDENLMMLVPPLFSLKDVPENLVLRPSATMSSKKKQEGVVEHRWEMEIEPCLAIDFAIKEVPKRINWAEHIPQETDQWKWQMAVSSLFDERPIWPKVSISERLANIGLKFGDHMLKRLLFRVAYYFKRGPFHRFWIRKGYDPRKDPESRIYQIIDIRVPYALRGYCDVASGSVVVGPINMPAVNVPGGPLKSIQTQQFERKKFKWEDLCNFRVFPVKRQIYFQLFELVDDYIQQEIRKPPQEKECNHLTGWFKKEGLDSLRAHVTLRLMSVHSSDGAENPLRVLSRRFRRCKKMRYHVNLKSGEENESQVNQELPGEENKVEEEEEDEENESEDEEGEEDEESVSDDEGEEELNMDDPSYLGGEDTDFPLQSHSYLGGEKVTRDYLQDLFQSFPCADDTHSQGQDVCSDGEYQIYEQGSDDNNSDDDY